MAKHRIKLYKKAFKKGKSMGKKMKRNMENWNKTRISIAI